MQKSIIALATLASVAFPSKNNFISDEWFEREVTLTQFLYFISSFEGSISISNKVKIYQESRKNHENPVFIAAILQCESGAIISKGADLTRAMGYGIMDPSNRTFEHQIERGCWLLRKMFDGYYWGAVVAYQRAPWEKGPQRFFYPENAATYARCVYCPVEADYWEHDKNGVAYHCGGNAVFEKVNSSFMEIFEKQIKTK